MNETLPPPKFWEQFVDDVYSILKLRTWKNFSNLYQNIKFTMEEESNGELALHAS